VSQNWLRRDMSQCMSREWKVCWGKNGPGLSWEPSNTAHTLTHFHTYPKEWYQGHLPASNNAPRKWSL
jgi:hypothetical protein